MSILLELIVHEYNYYVTHGSIDIVSLDFIIMKIHHLLDLTEHLEEMDIQQYTYTYYLVFF